MKALSWLREVSGGLSLLLLLLLVTSGWGLMANYVAADSEAFSSVLYLRQQVWGGAFLRSIHYHLASAVVVSGFLYLMATFLCGRHTTARTRWWLAVGLYLLLLAICFTGYLLPMDQNAYWGTVVRLGIVETVPAVGPTAASILRGGLTFNASTLPRFFGLHVAILPSLALLLLIPLLKRVAEAVQSSGRRARWLVVGLGVLAAVFLLAGYVSAPLEPRADPADSEYVPRPEWYFLWLFQLGKYVESVPWVQSLLLPLLGLGLLFALPFMTKPRLAARASLAGGWALAWLFLTGLALYEDRDLPPKLEYEEAALIQAETNYQDLCYECHGAEGRGDGPRSRVFALDARDFTAAEIWLETPEIEMKRAIRDGKGKEMPAFGKRLTADEIDALLRYLETNFAPQNL